MTDTALRLALREMRKRFSSTRFWAVMVAIALLRGLSGPFETAGFLRLGPRLGYWLLMVVATFSAGLFIQTLLSQGPVEPSAPNWTQVARAGIVAGIAVAFVLLLIDRVALNVSPLQAGNAFWLALKAVTSARRCGDKLVLTLSDGRDIPVSRTYLKTIRDAGLLPG